MNQVSVNGMASSTNREHMQNVRKLISWEKVHFGFQEKNNDWERFLKLNWVCVNVIRFWPEKRPFWKIKVDGWFRTVSHQIWCHWSTMNVKVHENNGGIPLWEQWNQYNTHLTHNSITIKIKMSNKIGVVLVNVATISNQMLISFPFDLFLNSMLPYIKIVCHDTGITKSEIFIHSLFWLWATSMLQRYKKKKITQKIMLRSVGSILINALINILVDKNERKNKWFQR